MHVGLHELLDQVDLCELFEGGGFDDVEDGDDVFVLEPSEELDLSQRTEAEHCAYTAPRRGSALPLRVVRRRVR